MVQVQLANISFEKAKEHSHDHNIRNIRPKYLMPSFYQNELYGVPKCGVESINLSDGLSFDELWNKRRDEMKHDVMYRGKTKRVDKHKGKKPPKQNCHWGCVIGFNENIGYKKLTNEHIVHSVKEVGKIFNIEPVNIHIHKDEEHLLRIRDDEGIFLSDEKQHKIYPLSRDKDGKFHGGYITDSDGKAYYIHIKTSKSGKQYYEKGQEIRYECYEPIFFFHAHVEWNSLVNERNQMQRFKDNCDDESLDGFKVFRKVYDTNAEILGMKKEDGKENKHKSLQEHKEQSHANRKIKELENENL